MIKVGFICNTSAAFPLVQWLQSQGCLAGIGVMSQQSDFFSDIRFIAAKMASPLQIFQKENLTAQLTEWQHHIQADIVLVLGFPYRIKKSALTASKHGIFNIHFGKLPEFGGNSPVFWQIRQGTKSGVLTVHQMNEEFDNGPVAITIPFEINEGQTYGMVETNYSYTAVNGVFQLLEGILKNTLTLQNQPESTEPFYPKPSLTNLVIDWQKMDAASIVALAKATNPWNRGAIARINGLDVKVIEAKIAYKNTAKEGQIIQISASGMEVGCAGNTSLLIKILYSQFGYLEGENLASFGLKAGDQFEQIIV